MRVEKLIGTAMAAGVVSTAVVGLSATSALALNHNTYNSLRNANTHQYCLDIRSQDRPEGAGAQLWSCTHPVPDEQEFILVSADRHDGTGPVPGQDTIRPRGSRGAGRCLWGGNGQGARVTQVTCLDYAQAQSWDLRTSGEIVNIYSGLCLEGANVKGGAVVTQPCNGGIAQRWFF